MVVAGRQGLCRDRRRARKHGLPGRGRHRLDLLTRHGRRGLTRRMTTDHDGDAPCLDGGRLNRRRSNGSRGGSEAFVIPLGALSSSGLRLFGIFIARCRQVAGRAFYASCLQGRLRHLRSPGPEHAVARRAAAARGALRRACRRGSAWSSSAGRARSCSAASPPAPSRCRFTGAARPSSASSLMALAGMVVGGIWIGAVGALRHYRGGQRDDLEPADGLYRHRADEPSGRGAAARSGQPQQALDRAARRGLSDRQHPRHGRPLGPRRRHRRLHRLLGADREDAPGALPRASPAAMSARRRSRACRSGR